MNKRKSVAGIHEMTGLKRLGASLKDVSLWVGMFPLGWVLRKLPIGLMYRVAGLISLPAYLVAINRRRILKEEVGRLFGDRLTALEVENIVKRTFSIYLKRQVENVGFDRMTKEELASIVTVEGWDHFNATLNKGKGVIILLAHFGSFLLPLPFLAYNGYTVYQIAGKPLIDDRRFIIKKVFEARKKQTDRMPFRFFLSDRYLGPVVRALKRGSIVVIAFDGRSGTEMKPMPFLNRTAQFSPGPFNLARRTGATIIPTFVVRGCNDRHRIIFEIPMEIQREGDRAALVTHSMVKFLEIFEKYIAKYPCHFAMTLFGLRRQAELGFNPPLFVD